MAKPAIIDGVLLFLLIMALVGYNSAQYPWMPEHVSFETVETIFWETGKE